MPTNERKQPSNDIISRKRNPSGLMTDLGSIATIPKKIFQIYKSKTIELVKTRPKG